MQRTHRVLAGCVNSVFSMLSRAICFSSPLTMRGQSGGKASRNCRKKVTLSSIRTAPYTVSFRELTNKVIWNQLFIHCTTEEWKFDHSCVFLTDLQACVLSSVELQVLTSSCFKLRTVHNIPVTSNKDGKKHSHTVSFSFSYVWILCPYFLLSPFFFFYPRHNHKHTQIHTKASITFSAHRKAT